MSPAAPPVSVGVPVRNGMPYLPEALEAILRQSFAEFDVLICDNASTDETEEVSRDLVRADSRVRYLRVEADAGASANFNRCLAETSGRLFTWAASDDRLLPHYLERCVAHLDAHPDDVMCVPAVNFIDEAGLVVGDVHQPAGISSPELARRLKSYLDRRSWYMAYGLIRRHAFEDTQLLQPRYGPDVILLWEMLLRSSIGTLDEILVDFRRYQLKEAEAVWRGIQPEGAASVPPWLHIGLFKALLECCERENLDPAARATGRRALYRWLASGPFRDLVVDDLRDELRRPGRRPNRLYDAALIASMAALRPSRGFRIVRRQPIVPTLRQHVDRGGTRGP